MADRRVRIAEDMDSFVESLVKGDDSSGPFSLKADVIAFAAAVGARRGRHKTIKKATKEPIRLSVFESNGYDTLINLLAVHRAGDPAVLGRDEARQDERVTIFEEYALGGLEFIQQELKGASDYTERILLLLQDSRIQEPDDDDDLNLSQFLK